MDGLAHKLGLAPADVLRQTDKSLLIAGAVGDQPVVVKLLLDHDEFWRTRLDHEIGVYRTFAHHQSPIRVPKLVHSIDGRLLVLERLVDRCHDAKRYPTHVLSEADVTAVAALHTWTAPANRSPEVRQPFRGGGRAHGVARTRLRTAATPEQRDVVFLTNMVPHHSAAVPMAQNEVELGTFPAAQDLAKSIKTAWRSSR